MLFESSDSLAVNYDRAASAVNNISAMQRG